MSLVRVCSMPMHTSSDRLLGGSLIPLSASESRLRPGRARCGIGFGHEWGTGSGLVVYAQESYVVFWRSGEIPGVVWMAMDTPGYRVHPPCHDHTQHMSRQCRQDVPSHGLWRRQQ
jgi:hypothetical protein